MTTWPAAPADYAEHLFGRLDELANDADALRNELGGVLRELRKSRGLTLREACARAKVDPSNVSRMERGQAWHPKAARALYALLRPLPAVSRWK